MAPPQRGALFGGGWYCPSMAGRTQEVFGAPRSGMALVMAADCAPGIAATFSRARSYKEFSWFACEATSAGSVSFATVKFSARNPSGSARRRSKVLLISPDPISRTTVSAICAVTIEFSARRLDAPPDAQLDAPRLPDL